MIELGTVISGPFTGSLLADLGAEIIKIEAPGHGDVQRHGGLKKDGVHPWWGVAARGKRCMTLNLKHPEGKSIFERLIRKADVFVENYRPGALKKLGFDWEAVHAMNSRLVMLSISGYGSTGTSAGRPGFGKVAEGLSGAVTMTGIPDEPPLMVGFSLADTCTGMFGAFGISLALYHRDMQNGQGSWIDLALYEPLFRMVECQRALLQSLGVAPKRQATNDPYGWGVQQPDRPSFSSVKASDGQWFLISLPAAAMGALPPSNTRSMEAWAGALTPAELQKAVKAAGGDIVPVLDGMSLSRNEYLRARGDVIDVTDPTLGRLSVPGPIVPMVPMAGAPNETRTPYHDAAVGEQTEYVLRQHLGMSPSDIERLRLEGVV